MGSDELSIARWYGGNDIAFVWGIDEVGNIGSEEGMDFTDWGHYFDRQESFWQSTFLPIIERFPEISFTIGTWLGAYDAATPKEELLERVESYPPRTEAWEDWASNVLEPLSKHEQIELVAHGLGHEDWLAIDAEERHRRIERIKQLFEKAVGQSAYGFNTWPYGTIPRKSLPGLLADHDLFVTGILTTPQLSRRQRVKNLFRQVVSGKRYADVRNCSKPIGQVVQQGPDFSQRIGEMAYWSVDKQRIVSLPYTSQLKGNSPTVITNKIAKLIDNANEFTSPTFYMFSHLRGTSAEQQSPARNPDGIEGQPEKFEKVLEWLTEQNSIWFSTLSEAAMYHDIRESASVSVEEELEGFSFSIDCSDCLEWPRSVTVTLQSDLSPSSIDYVQIETSGGVRNIEIDCYQDKGGKALFDCPIGPDLTRITGHVVFE